MSELYTDVSFKISKLVTSSYSTSFSIAVKFLQSDLRKAIYSIYGFVRFADEIVDTFHNHDKKFLLQKFEKDYYEAMDQGISLNPILNSFQETVKKYNINDGLIRAFLNSMKIDLSKNDHTTEDELNEYIFGSAEAVGLMCLKVFTCGDDTVYSELYLPAKKLGAAFQKVNFLRDMKSDTESLNRRYFHETIGKSFNENTKNKIIDDIEKDFAASLPGIKKLPENARLGVIIAYYYYKRLLKKIKKTPAEKLLTTRVRVPDYIKILLLIKASLSRKLRYV
jgi:phytoene/squalene synthetase